MNKFITYTSLFIYVVICVLCLSSLFAENKPAYGDAVKFKLPEFYSKNCQGIGIVQDTLIDGYVINKIQCTTKDKGLHSLSFTIESKSIIELLTEEEYNKMYWR